jgi:short-subunit dehydrogenase|tara:strand:- start:764 stop:1390 length:627 start_codon:yes stop_codon:yes gene_type:complete
MRQHWAVFGANGGIGSACIKELEKRGQNVSCFTKEDLDFHDITAISTFDLSRFSHVINCTGHSKGTYKGFLANSYENIASQISVNFTGNILLLKNFACTNPSGHFTWIGTSLQSHGLRPFHSVYASTKEACTYSINLIKQEAQDFFVTEARVGLTATQFRYTNFEGTRDSAEVFEEYKDLNAMSSEECAINIVNAIIARHEYIEIFND